MRHIVIAVFALAPLFFILASCTAAPISEVRNLDELNRCLQEPVDRYGDICMEGIGSDPDTEEPFRTMLCGLQQVAHCIGAQEPTDP